MLGNNKIDKKLNKELNDLHKRRLEEVVPVAIEILRHIVSKDLPIGDSNAHDNDKFRNTAREIMEIILKHNLKYVDKEFLFQLVRQPIDQIADIVMKSLSRSFDLAIDKALKKDFREVRLEDLDRLIKGVDN